MYGSIMTILSENVEQLIDISLTFRESLTEEFGENDYWDEKLIKILEDLGCEVTHDRKDETLKVTKP